MLSNVNVLSRDGFKMVVNKENFCFILRLDGGYLVFGFGVLNEGWFRNLEFKIWKFEFLFEIWI